MLTWINSPMCTFARFEVTSRRPLRLLLAAGLLLAHGAAGAASAKPVAAEHGMVVTAQHLASEIGVAVLKDGGNAVDAAVAVGYALAVVYPAAGNLGGGGFATVVLADGRRTFIDFREAAPQAARADMYLDAAGQVIPNASVRGWRAVAVPGTVRGLEFLREKYGSRKRRDLLAPAIRLAEQGFILDAGDVRMLGEATADFRADPASAAIFLHEGRPFAEGERLVQKDLGRTLRAIAAEGAAGFYEGRVGTRLLAASQAGGGLLAEDDFRGYQVRELAPLECDYRGYHVVSAPPPSSGGVVLCESLEVLSGYPLAEWGFRSARAVHVQIEALRHAYADRNELLGDPDFVANPVARLIDPAYAARVRGAIDPQHAADSRKLRAGEPEQGGSNTTHYSILDDAGNAVALTYTLNDWFGARVTAAGTGVLMNDEMDDFTAKPGEPNMYGLVQGKANAIAPGKRPLSSMTPTVLTRDGKPVLVIGTPGGSRITTVVLHTILNLVDYGMDLQEAIDAPRFHQQWLPDHTLLEPFALSPDTRAMLEGMGHRFGPPQPANHAAGILIGASRLGGAAQGRARYFGANDPRRGTGLALGY